MKILISAVAGALALAAASCTDNRPPRLDPEVVQQEMEKAHAEAAAKREKSSLWSRGKAIYQTSCTSCHNSNPKAPGPLGPEVWGSSRELLSARVMQGSYPAGYKPKRPTHVMQALPQLSGELEALYIYLNQTQ